MSTKTIMHNGEQVAVYYPAEMPEGEVRYLTNDELARWDKDEPGKVLDSIDIRYMGIDEVEIKATERSPINRVRRITGYLAPIPNFNASKKEELADRVTHG